MLTATTTFIESLEKWTGAIRGSNLSAAREQAENLRWEGELLVIHPDFYRCFEQRCPDVDPNEALNTLAKFLMCATECRARALKG